MPALSFNGVTKNYLTVLRGSSRPAWAPIERDIVTISDLPGGYLSETNIMIRKITIPVLVKADDFTDLEVLKEDLASWLVTEKEEALVFSDEPDRTYFAVVDGTLDLDKLVKRGKGIITFICPDPYKYGPELPIDFQGSDVVSITNEGTAEAEPTFELEVLKPTTFALVQNQSNEYMMIGQPVDIEDFSAVEEYTTLLNNALTSTVGWTDGNNIDGGTIEGTIVSDGNGFVPETWGYAEGWHGPALKTSLSEVLTDFRVEAEVEFNSMDAPGLIGRLEIHLLDEVDEIVGKASIQDTYTGRSYGKGVVRAGDNTVGYHFIEEEPSWYRGNIIKGLLRITRRGKRWGGYITEIVKESGRHHTRSREFYFDEEQQFTRNVAQVQIHFGRRWSHNAPTMKVNNIKVDKINLLTSAQIPYIAGTGDIITFDHTKNGEVLINGEPYEAIPLGADFFPLVPGENRLTVFPFDTFNTIARYRQRFK
ncbi:putative phage tail component, N-terminal domain-containing protein [Thalassobacillus cyri]|uniref:Putative phage tail component, N-terminal domain-containing protein n=1 Tax=Thalassobacillus cyri TaxID=571932 RepID=A0A1H4C0W1_9BACI|nr:distal tail protein Dit [Thalassobacillus cyri]SEA54085.1 putative phage tail component, N-terminal domain-containing protein [Thalassobacillus cyri]